MSLEPLGKALLAAAVLASAALPVRGAADEAAPARASAEMMQRVDAARERVEAAIGHDGAIDFHRRLYDDIERANMSAPAGYSPADWDESVRTIARLDLEAANLLLAGTPTPLRAVPGVHEALIRSRVDGTLQFVAVYVPASAKAQHAPLAIVLHGNPQTEAELLGPPALRRLADRTGTILVSPFGRGNYDFAEPAATDVYDLLDEAQKAFDADRGRTYLVGYSMGGFSVFMIGPRGDTAGPASCASPARSSTAVCAR